jgi:pimeloyl-ACP methyl ester carboxylesterase
MSGPRGRYLAGQSSGAWSALWLQITRPELFGGVWAFAPDPVDFRNFNTIDVTPGSRDNAFRNGDGTPRMLMREGGRDIFSFEDFLRDEDVGGYVGAIGTFDWVFSPRGPRGEPMRLFDRATGEQDPVVQRAWEKWNIREVLEARWEALSPKLRGKLHIFVGDEDAFHLNESVALLCDFLKSKGSDAVCEILPQRGHFDLQGDETDPTSLVWRAEHEMAAASGAK